MLVIMEVDEKIKLPTRTPTEPDEVCLTVEREVPSFVGAEIYPFVLGDETAAGEFSACLQGDAALRCPLSRDTIPMGGYGVPQMCRDAGQKGDKLGPDLTIA